MTEQKLKEYLENTLTAHQLALDLKDSQKQTGADVRTYYIDDLDDGEFEIRKEHLIKLCNDTLSGTLLPIDLGTIGYALVNSDYFYWDEDAKDTEIIERVIFDWDMYEIGYDLTLINIGHWKEYLLTGIDNFDKNELKNKGRGYKKQKKQNANNTSE